MRFKHEHVLLPQINDSFDRYAQCQIHVREFVETQATFQLLLSAQPLFGVGNFQLITVIVATFLYGTGKM